MVLVSFEQVNSEFKEDSQQYHIEIECKESRARAKHKFKPQGSTYAILS